MGRMLLMLMSLACVLATDDKKVKTYGDIIFGGLFPMHEKGPSGTSCGRIKEEKGIQRMEAMMYAVDEINRDPDLLPNITIGVHILDTCSRDTYALEQSMDFIKSKITSLDATDYKCENNKTPIYTPSKPVVGVIGAAASSVSIMVANILRLFKIPQISYASTSSELSEDSRFGYFSRVVPPDTLQAQAMADVVKSFGWSYVSTLSDEGNYGEKGIAAFEEEAAKRGICVAKSIDIPREADDAFFNATITSFLKVPKATVVVMFVNEDNCRRLLRAALLRDEHKTLHWLASDSWGAKIHPVENQETAALGAITILPNRKVLTGFDKYFTSRNLSNNIRNPWFTEFWERHFQCSTNDSDIGMTSCTGSERISHDTSGYEQEGLVQFVVDAVYALAHAFHALLLSTCPDVQPHLCQQVHTFTGNDVLRSIRNVSFTGAGGTAVKFNSVGDGLGRYNVFQFQKVSREHYAYVKIGEWTDSLKIDHSQTQWYNHTSPPHSVCSEPCQAGYAKKVTESCCWICVPCGQYHILKNSSLCIECPLGTHPSRNKSTCDPLPIMHMEWASPAAIIPLIIAFLGILLTAFIFCVFVKYNNTPLVMASSRELCFVILTGIMLCFLMTIPMLSQPTLMTCAVLRAGTGVSLAMCYAAMLTKTNRISRIFNRTAKNMMKRPEYTSPKSQLVICSILVSFQVVGVVIWTMVDLPDAVKSFPDRHTVILRCKASEMTLVISLSYNMLLIIMCTVYAVKTRKIPENFNEAKYIAFTMYSTCIVWLAFIPIYFGTGNNFLIQITTLSVCTSISAYVVLFCLFVPKLYIILLAPHKNVRPTSLSTSLKGFGASFAKTFPVLPSHNSSIDEARSVDKQGHHASTPRTNLTSVSSDLCTDMEDSCTEVTDLKTLIMETLDTGYESRGGSDYQSSSSVQDVHDRSRDVSPRNGLVLNDNWHTKYDFELKRRNVCVTFSDSDDVDHGPMTDPLMNCEHESSHTQATSGQPPDVVICNEKGTNRVDGGRLTSDHYGTISDSYSPRERKRKVRVSFSDESSSVANSTTGNCISYESACLLPSLTHRDLTATSIDSIEPTGGENSPTMHDINKEMILKLDGLKESVC